MAVRAAAHDCLLQLGARACDLALVFFSAHHTERAEEISKWVREMLRPVNCLGVSAESVLGGAIELERTPGVAILTLSLPDVRLSAFTSDSFPPLDAKEKEHVAVLAGGIGAAQDTAATIVFADPFSIPVLQLIPMMNRARRLDSDGRAIGKVIGGLASAARAPGGNVMFLDGKVMRFGAVGVTISGGVEIETIVSQGCRAVGQPMVITRAKNNLILQLGGRPAREVMREVVNEMDPGERGALSGGLFLGRVINEYRERFGRDDFLIRAVVGEDPASGSIAVADFVRAGQTVQFHVRDADTATQDLSLLLDGQRLHERPAGGLLVTCNGQDRPRGSPPAAGCPATAGLSLRSPARDLQRPGNEAVFGEESRCRGGLPRVRPGGDRGRATGQAGRDHRALVHARGRGVSACGLLRLGRDRAGGARVVSAREQRVPDAVSAEVGAKRPRG